MAYKWSSRALMLGLGVLLAAGCDESLPPRSEPAQVVVASISPAASFIILRDTVPIPRNGALTASLKNVYDDVLQKEANIQGEITVWMANNPGVRRTLRLSAENLAHPTLSGKLITLIPHDSAKIVVPWDQRTDDGVPFWNYVHIKHVFDIGGDYWDSDSIEFVAQATVQVFANVQARQSPQIHYHTMYRLFGDIHEPY